MEPRLPAFPGPDMRRVFYGESSASDLYQRLTLARNLAAESNLNSTAKGKEYHDRKAQPHNYSTHQMVLLEEYYFLGRNPKLSPKWSGPHEIVSLKGTHNVELLTDKKKKMIVNVDRIKPYTLPITLEETTPEVQPGIPIVKEEATEKITVPMTQMPKGDEQLMMDTEESEVIPQTSKPMNNEEPEVVPQAAKRGRPRKVPSEKQPINKKNKWVMPPPAASTSQMVTRSRGKPIQMVNAIKPCFCGNQRLLRPHAVNCKQQMRNWVLTGDTYLTRDAWAHDSEWDDLQDFEEDLEEDLDLPGLFDETGYHGSSNIDPDEVREEEDEPDTEEPPLPGLYEFNPADLDDTLPSQYDTPNLSMEPLHHSTPERTGTKPKSQPDNLTPRVDRKEEEPNAAFGPEDLYQARLAQIHHKYQQDFKQVTNPKEAKHLRQSLYKQLEDAETSYKLILRTPRLMELSPEELKQHFRTQATPSGKAPTRGFFTRKPKPMNQQGQGGPQTRSQTQQDNKR